MTLNVILLIKFNLGRSLSTRIVVFRYLGISGVMNLEQRGRIKALVLGRFK